MAGTKQQNYSFIVVAEATKHQIKDAVESLFKVDVLSVTTTTTRGKMKRVGKRRELVQRPSKKKATVKIKAGQQIDVVPTQPEEAPHETTKH
jgi:large subunit ribosomal protein L23